jgi:hypothetical protein
MPPPFNQGGSGPPFNPLSPSETLLLTQLSGIQQGVNLGNPPGAEYTPVGWAGGVEGEGTGFSDLANFLMNGWDITPPQSDPGAPKPGTDPSYVEPYIYQKIIDSKLPQSGGGDYQMQLWENQCPPLIGPPCDDNQANKIRQAWGQAMDKINRETSLLQSWLTKLGQCGDTLKNLLKCIINMPTTDFSQFPGNLNSPIVIGCDNTMPFTGATEKVGQFTQITINFNKLTGYPLDAVIFHEMVHACADQMSGQVGTNDLEAKFFETLLYGPGKPFGVNVPSKGDPNQNGNWIEICCSSRKIKQKILLQTGQEFPSNLIISNSMAWDLHTGHMYCVDSTGKIDLAHQFPLGNMALQTDGLDYSKCDASDTRLKCN